MSQDSVVDGGFPVSEAAEMMGITPAALRKRIKRKTVDATKVDGQWYVYVEEELRKEDQHETNGDTVIPEDVTLVLARQQMETFRETFVTPLIETIQELEYERGQLSERVIHLEEELRRRDEEEAEEITKKPWWRFWS